jgi:predicted type IV restriction endonuclease
MSTTPSDNTFTYMPFDSSEKNSDRLDAYRQKMKTYDEARIERLTKSLEAWKESAEATVKFIQDHIAIIGEHEIKGYQVVKDLFNKAKKIDGRH